MRSGRGASQSRQIFARQTFVEGDEGVCAERVQHLIRRAGRHQPTAPTEHSRLRSCARKKAHASRAAAKHIARLTERENRGTGRLHAYSCRFCGMWHVGHSGR